MEMALQATLAQTVPTSRGKLEVLTYLPLGSVCFDHVGVHLITVEAHEGGKCSSNIIRYQYLINNVSQL